MIVYTSPSVPPLKGKGWLRTVNALAEEKDIACPAIPKRKKNDGVLRFSVLSPCPGEGKGVWG